MLQVELQLQELVVTECAMYTHCTENISLYSPLTRLLSAQESAALLANKPASYGESTATSSWSQ